MRPSLPRRGLLAAAAALAAPRVLARPLDEARDSGWLRIALYEDYAPFSAVEAGVPRGIDADLGTRIAQELGLAPRWLTRQAGESVDDDLRLNVWRGDLTGSGTADLMLHVPLDRELARRNDQVAIFGGYLRHQLALAYEEARTGPEPGFEVFERLPIGVETDTNSDFYLLSAQGGRVRANVRHYLPFEAAMEALRGGEVAAVMAQRGQLEGHLRAPGDDRFRLMVPRLPAVFGREWTVGAAVKADSRDLGYAIGDVLDALRESGEIAAICRRHGVTWLAPQG
ncbi:substrate-binding periplasmic protein [Paracraurococcus lichenis]|uniref:Transporter substrate-binding domain-containing protein n=1 Tax=Paracraurococcus lichenis TaxID=3064888 RepID=A0ABT9E0S0_9PROT|nr:transporter substrate-binding domain-containing protein [Paracraurococcus sp. LOR1-02]MDO9709728.1 transporter substrate-binding domain-containing protein [Paracraurococcus sp. LOR1-02]